jgi:C4-dicarboxylate-specific signal transduction histidine kinase
VRLAGKLVLCSSRHRLSDHRLLMPDGLVNHVHIVIEAVGLDPENREFVGTVMDVTARKRAEEAWQKMRAELAHVSRVATMGELTALIAHELPRRHVEIELDLSRELPPVLADRVQLQQVLLNLVMNGVEAMNEVPEGSRKIWVRAEPYAHNGSSAVLVSVQDSGSGLKQVDVDRLFEAFYTTKSQGLGMGLGINPSIVEAHGGRLWLASAGGPWGNIPVCFASNGLKLIEESESIVFIIEPP